MKRQPEPKNNLVEKTPVEEGKKLSTISHPYTQSDLMGLTWVFSEKDW
ncbi:MAG TPA: hypothetical protein VFG25_03190 [Nitrosopumilaceae archaeon]|nr:hypothetical protein [Nitrosopumilaceae archaeon]